jgi:hypothetical protein
MWPEQAIQLLGYMCYPNDAEAREDFVLTLRSWPEASEDAPPSIPDKLGRIRNDWLRVADILHLLCDLAEGRHQARRGGPSVGKAITLVEVNAKSWGTKASSLWGTWSTYKNVAHVVTAATHIFCVLSDSACSCVPRQADGPRPIQLHGARTWRAWRSSKATRSLLRFPSVRST